MSACQVFRQGEGDLSDSAVSLVKPRSKNSSKNLRPEYLLLKAQFIGKQAVHFKGICFLQLLNPILQYFTLSCFSQDNNPDSSQLLHWAFDLHRASWHFCACILISRLLFGDAPNRLRDPNLIIFTSFQVESMSCPRIYVLLIV